MDKNELFPRLRACLLEYLDREDRPLQFVATHSGVEYNRLWRFREGTYVLPLLDADTLHIFLTGKPLIAADHV